MAGAWREEDCLSGKRTTRGRQMDGWEARRATREVARRGSPYGGGRRDRGSGDVADGEWTRRQPELWTDGALTKAT